MVHAFDQRARPRHRRQRRRAGRAERRQARRSLAALLHVLAEMPADVSPDLFAQALPHFRQRAEWADAGGMFDLGEMYDNGEAVPADHAQALVWYRKAAQAGDRRAQGLLKRLEAESAKRGALTDIKPAKDAEAPQPAARATLALNSAPCLHRPFAIDPSPGNLFGPGDESTLAPRPVCGEQYRGLPRRPHLG